jgi:hypothetical protein
MSDDFASRLRRTADDTRRFDPRRDFMLLMARELRAAADEIDRLNALVDSTDE